MELVPDETYYWDWTRFLSTGYFDHPPMLAWLTWLNTLILGDTYWAIKAVPLLCGLGISIILFFLGKRFLKSDTSMVYLIILTNFTMVFAVGGLLLTPDIPLVFFWTISLLFAYKALFENDRVAWLWLGVFIGLGMLSKYTFVIFGLALFLYMVSNDSSRKLFLSWKPYAALIISLLTLLPNLMWNINHQWQTVVFQFFSRSGGEIDLSQRFQYILEYLSSQAGLVSPFVFIGLIITINLIFRKYPGDLKLRFLAVFTIVPFLFFGFFSFSKHIEPNWPAAGYVTGIIMLCWFWEKTDDFKLRRYISFAAIFSVITTLVVLIHGVFPFLPIKPKNDRTLLQRGWKEIVQQVNEERNRIDPYHRYPLTANSYQMASLLAFYSPDHPRTYSLNLHTRSNQYAMLSGRNRILGDTLLFIAEVDEKSLESHLKSFFDSYDFLKYFERRFSESYVKSFGMYKILLTKEAREIIRNE
jgi:4-amino-4-deoxy-L-arabinose transferase-like glycosyltransferase